MSVIWSILVILYIIFWITQLMKQLSKKQVWWFALTLIFPILAVVYYLTEMK